MKKWPAWLPSCFVISAVLSAALYLGLVTWKGGTQGFPLDDAWIHQTYARNLVREGQWSYVPGRPSTGSTAPLWTLLLTPAYLTGINARLWTYLLGVAMLLLVAGLGRRLGRHLFGEDPPVGTAVALFCLFEWHLVWAAFSGMETLLFSTLVLLCLERYVAFEKHREAEPRDLSLGLEDGVHRRGCPWLQGLWMGLAGGMLVLTRPEGLVLLGLIALAFLVKGRRNLSWASAVWALSSVFACLVLLVPYVLFNLSQAGFVFPTTFYAKQAEYRAMIESLSLPVRFGRLLLAVWTGPQVLLIPGFLVSVVSSLRQRRPEVVLLWTWWLCNIAIYAFRLPVAYQHGRYLIPAVPVFVLLGVWGSWHLVRISRGWFVPRVLGRAWGVATIALVVVFWFMGAGAYADDVAFIYGEMGAMAHWLRGNTSTEDRLAVHDIGLVGYVLHDRPFIDLAGLVTPEVIPFIDDERELLAFMEAQDVDYVVVFPDWSPAYRRLVEDPRLIQVYNTGHPWTRSHGQENLSAYRTRW